MYCIIISLLLFFFDANNRSWLQELLVNAIQYDSDGVEEATNNKLAVIIKVIRYTSLFVFLHFIIILFTLHFFLHFIIIFVYLIRK